MAKRHEQKINGRDFPAAVERIIVMNFLINLWSNLAAESRCFSFKRDFKQVAFDRINHIVDRFEPLGVADD